MEPLNTSQTSHNTQLFTMERPAEMPRAEEAMGQEMVEILDQYLPDVSSRIKEKIEESLQNLEYEVACIKQNLEVKKPKVTLRQVNEKLDKLLEMVELMNYKMN